MKSSIPSEKEKHRLAARLIALAKADLRMRDRLMAAGQLSEGYHPEMERLHESNASELAEIIGTIGYPTAGTVGEEASNAAWLIVQHAIGNPPLMRQCRDLLATAVAEGTGNAEHLAYLTDRIAVLEGKPQRYGTQFDWDEDGLLSPLPFDELEAVDKRRRELGWPPLFDRVMRMRERARKEGDHPPADKAAKAEKYRAWRIRVGWTTSEENIR